MTHQLFVVSNVGDVLACDITTNLKGKEPIREFMKNCLGVQWVWFPDERGTELDPVDGPKPKYGPKARAFAERN